jgi:hypothetical protein
MWSVPFETRRLHAAGASIRSAFRPEQFAELVTRTQAPCDGKRRGAESRSSDWVPRCWRTPPVSPLIRSASSVAPSNTFGDARSATGLFRPLVRNWPRASSPRYVRPHVPINPDPRAHRPRSRRARAIACEMWYSRACANVTDTARISVAASGTYSLKSPRSGPCCAAPDPDPCQRHRQCALYTAKRFAATGGGSWPDRPTLDATGHTSGDRRAAGEACHRRPRAAGCTGRRSVFTEAF